MATRNIPTTSPEGNPTPSTYRLAGSCSVRAYVACDDTPYHLEKPVKVILPNPNPNHTPERAAKVRALVCATSSARRLQSVSSLVELIDANPNATVAELLNLLNQ